MNQDLKALWKKCEKKEKRRDFYFRKIIRTHLFLKYLNREPVLPRYAQKKVLGTKDTNKKIYEMIQNGNPFMAGRFGYTEMTIATTVLDQRINGITEKNQQKLEQWFVRACDGAGLFPNNINIVEKFTNMILDACKEVDILGMWHIPMEEFVIECYMPHAQITHLLRLEPWLSKNPWSKALEGKRVLVVHPFEDSILQQYKEHREQIFQDKNVLPRFELLTYKAIQTSAGERDNRFRDWFEALDYMYYDILKLDFDIAIIGCGAYGFPLAAKLKQAGKQAIHLGGATQLMFGIKGKRWVENYPSKIGTLMNEYWIYPDESEVPQNAKVVENGCYWK